MKKPILKFSYSQRKNVDPTKRATIFCRVTCGRKLDYRFSTELKVEPKFFNAEMGRCEFPQRLYDLLKDPEHADNVRLMVDFSIDEKLGDLERYIMDIQTICDIDRVEFNTKAVKSHLNSKKGWKGKPLKLSYFSEYVEMFIESVSREKAPRLISVRGYERKLAPSTIRRYKHTFNKFQRIRKGTKENAQAKRNKSTLQRRLYEVAKRQRIY